MLLHTPILSFPHIGLVPTGSIFFCQTWIHIGLFGFRFVCKVIKIQQLSGILDIWYKTTPWWLWRALRRFIFYLVWNKLHVLVVVQSEETTSTYKWNAFISLKSWLVTTFIANNSKQHNNIHLSQVTRIISINWINQTFSRLGDIWHIT